MACVSLHGSNMANILVVDDDGHIRQVVRYALTHAGHQVREAKDGAQALAAVRESAPDLIVLDILLPEEDGLQVCRTVRKESKVPIIFLSSRDEELDRVMGLELGADDYMTKPFSPRELVARISAVLRRALPEQRESRVLRYQGLVMDEARHSCTFEGRELTLTVVEFALLFALLSAPGRVFERAQMVTQAYGHGHYITDRTVDSHIRRVRKKLAEVGADPIETVYGVGYRLREHGA
jgi:two-component system, OmpR family, response regulator